jgi:hypothetical protein
MSDKLGFVLLILGAMHFFNLYVFSRIRQRRPAPLTASPVMPDTMLRAPLAR